MGHAQIPMRFTLTLFKFLAALYVLLFAGAMIGAFFGLMLVAFGVVDFQQMAWCMAVGAALIVVLTLLSDNDGSVEEREHGNEHEPRPKSKRSPLSAPWEFLDEERNIKMYDPDDPFEWGL